MSGPRMRAPGGGSARRLPRPRCRVPARLARGAAIILLPGLCAVLSGGCAGTINDALEEARRGDAASVRDAVARLGEFLREKEVDHRPFDAADLEALRYLRDVAGSGVEAQTRAGAIDALASLEAPEALEGDLLVRALADPSWVVQMEAARALARRPRKDAAPALAARLRSEIALEAQIQVVRALAAAGGEEAIDALLDAFLDPATRYQRTRLAIYHGLVALTGRHYPITDATAWTSLAAERKSARPAPPPASEADLKPAGSGADGSTVPTGPDGDGSPRPSS